LGQVVSQSELVLHRGEWKRSGKGVVCASGCFDLLHPGHIRLLEQARSLGDVLVVAVESDASIWTADDSKSSASRPPQSASLKPSRPITPAAERMEILAALAAVDYVVEFDDPTPSEFLKRLLPDVAVKGGSAGSDQSAFLEASELEALGCRVVRVPLEPGHSTTRLIERIAQLPA
jgi:rfaE bifunctional protein nucleotidyltransferase chain/domain